MKKKFLILGMVFLLSACGTTTFSPPATASWPTTGWQTATPESQGMDSALLVEALEEILSKDIDIDAVLVVRNGYLVLEAAHAPYNTSQRHIIHSCTKSIVSALIGIAIEEGYISGVDQKVVSFFPDRQVKNMTADKQAMTVEHLLTMTTGFECRDSYLYDWDGLRDLFNSQDWVQHILDLPMEGPPGQTFEYCNSSSFLLSAILTETTGLSALDYARQKLFTPLGITNVEWPANPAGINYGWGELHLQPADMAKFGYLYLNKGLWDGQRVVPVEWVQASTSRYINATLEDGYGYQWWLMDEGIFLALGYQGQFIYVAPELGLVVVFVSELEDQDFYVPQELLMKYILPSIQGGQALEANLEMENELQEMITALAQE